MMKQLLLMPPLVMALLLSTGVSLAAEETPAQETVQTQQQVYGYQLMTNDERMQMRNKMRAAKTAEEREKIQAEHHELMKIRAKEQGVSLPDQPMMKGGGMDAGMGAGQKRAK